MTQCSKYAYSTPQKLLIQERSHIVAGSLIQAWGLRLMF